MRESLVIVLVLITVGFGFAELRRSLKLRSWIRVFLLAIATASMYFLLYPPIYHVEAKKKDIVWLNSKAAKVPDSLSNDTYKVIRSFGELMTAKKELEVSSLLLIGEGIPDEERVAIDEPTRFQSSVETKGITGIRSDKIVYSNRPFELTLAIRAGDSMTISGKTEFGSLDSVQIPAGESTIRLSLEIPVDGYHLIDIIGRRTNDTLFQEVFPVKVLPETEPKFLLLGSSPSFEQRYLLNFLQEEGISVDVRQQLSPDIFRTKFVNSSTRQLSQITKQLLDDYQVLLIDPEAYANLSRSLQRHITQRVKSGRMGIVFVDVDENTRLDDFGIRVNKTTEKSLNPDFPDQRFALYEVSTSNELQNINISNHRMASSTKIGLGSISIPLVGDSYRLLLQGDSTTFRKYWSRTLDASVGYQYENEFLHAPKINFAAEKSEILMFGDPEIAEVPDSLLVIENTFRPGFFKVAMWPTKQGWIDIPGKTGKLYVQSDDSWKALRAERLALETAHWASSTQQKSGRTKQIEQSIPNWVFFLIFLLSVGGLWLEEKFRA